MTTACRVLLFLALVVTVNAQSPTPADVHIKLSFAGNKTVYRIGEPIKVVMEFTADREGYLVEVLPDRTEVGLDTVVVSPETGVTNWIDELHDNRPYRRDVLSTEKLTNTPKRLELTLNDKLRFESPGRYTVYVRTRRVMPGSGWAENEPHHLSTNSISFELQSISEADEAKEVKRLSDLLDAKPDNRTYDELTNQLSYLTGDPSTREKVRRFIAQEQQSRNHSTHIFHGLFTARNRALVLKLIENSMRDPAIPLTSNTLYVATRLKTLLTHGVREKVDPRNASLNPAENPQFRSIREAYVVELAAGLGKRTDNSQITTALTIFTSVDGKPPVDTPGRREARRILVQQFDSLNPVSQQWLLERHWEEMRDPVLVPSFKKMLTATGVFSKHVREAALKRLIEMAPDEARSYVIAEIRDQRFPIDPKILGQLKDESLPEVDAVLLEQIRRQIQASSTSDLIYLGLKAPLVVRFATGNIYQELKSLYEAMSPKLTIETRAALLAYFAKHNEREAIPLIEQAISELKPGAHHSFLSGITSLYYSESIGVLLKKVLETDDLDLVSYVAYLLGKHGLAGDEQILEARLKRWREQWRDRIAEADAQHQGRIERELISALIKGNSWKLPPDRVRELQSSCLTQLCKQSHLVKQ